MLSVDELFKGRHFEREIIILSVRWYLRYKLSFRDLVEMMAERSLSLADEPVANANPPFGTVTPPRSMVAGCVSS